MRIAHIGMANVGSVLGRRWAELGIAELRRRSRN
jgi:hypothetical protein